MNIPLPPSRFSILRPFRAAALAAALLAAPALLVNHASAVTYTWDGETSGELNIATNWVGNVAPVSGNSTDMIIAGTANVTNLYCGGSTGIAYTLRSLTFDATNDANTRFVMVQNANVNNSGRNLTFSSSSGNATLTVEEGSTGNKVIDRTFGGTGSAASIILTSSLDVIHNGSGTLTLGNGNTGNGTSRVTGAGNLNKSGTGTLILAGNNTYTGTTLVTAGTLLVNGALAAGSAVTVDSGATLGGSGTINGAAVVNGNLRPGNSPGVLTFGSSLTLSATSAVTMELNGTVRGTGYDGINVNGALTYGGALTITVGSAFLGSTETFSLFTSGSQSSDFASVSLEGAYGSGIFTNSSGVWSLTDSSGNQWSFSQASGDLGFTAVPEPSTWAMLASALGLLAVSRYRLARKK